MRTARDQGQDLWEEVHSGEDVRLAVVTLWMMDAEPVRKLLLDNNIKPLLRWILLDKVHLFNELASVWRTPYQGLKELRARLLSWKVWGAFTGTASVAEARAILCLRLIWHRTHRLMVPSRLDYKASCIHA